MKNPFIKESNNGGLIAGIIMGAAAAGTGIYFYLKKRKALAEAAAYAKEHANDYLQDKVHAIKKHKTDLHELHSIAAN